MIDEKSEVAEITPTESPDEPEAEVEPMANDRKIRPEHYHGVS